MSTTLTQVETLSAMYELVKDNNRPSDKAIICRNVLEKAIDYIFQYAKLNKPVNATLLELINHDTVKEFIDNDVMLDSLHFVRIVGNNAHHEKPIKRTQALVACNNIELLLEFMKDKLEPVVNTTAGPVKKASSLNEDETRKVYIDTYLNEAGWEVVEPNSEYTLANGKKRKCGHPMPAKACCEIPVEGLANVSKVGFCDYVLYGKNGKPLAVVEAKKASVKASVGQQQVKEYGDCLKKQYGYVPILYYTNGYEIYVLDGKYPARLVSGFHTLHELEYLIQARDITKISDISINDNISSRPYQKIAINKICERFNERHRKGLLVMATGTGKTRVSISLVDVLTRNRWVKNVLFLADRTSLVRQAFKNFKSLLPDMTYTVLSDKSLADEPNARITFSTHQTMINIIDSENKGEFTIGRYDLIIIDEAHRSIFNKYGAIFSYFDSLLVGLTATPKEDVDANTYQLFNCESGTPNFVYSLDEAVHDKYLVPYQVLNKTTQLIKSGIKYKDLSAADKLKVDLLIEDGFSDGDIISGNTLFKVIYNEDTCRKVIEELMTKGLKVNQGQQLGKTIIFAYNHKHAELIVDTFNKMYPEYLDYCQLIDNQIKNSEHLIDEFGVKDHFRIAVSVDMLDTGIDVPSVLNLVFFKQVRSKIKFVQMIGRGTRLCPGLIDGNDKTHFQIFDYCGNFEYFDQHPYGTDGQIMSSINQKLFDIRVDLLEELQKYDHQIISEEKSYYDEIKVYLHAQVSKLKKSSRLSVRANMSLIDKYKELNQWTAISLMECKEVKMFISPLIMSDVSTDSKILSFDLKMLKIEYAYLTSGKIDTVMNIVQKVRDIAKELMINYASIQAVMDKAHELQNLISGEYWNSVNVSQLEKSRKAVRELMQYIEHEHYQAFINTDDEVLDGVSVNTGLVDIRTYREKVLDYLVENSSNPTIQKIKHLEPINNEDLKELENILWFQTGTKDDYYKLTKIDNLAVFIRSIVGVDQTAVNEKFKDYLSDNYLTSEQQEFIYSIINYVRENGDIIGKNVIYEAPFNNYSLYDLFGEKAVVVNKVVNTIHNCVVVQ